MSAAPRSRGRRRGPLAFLQGAPAERDRFERGAARARRARRRHDREMVATTTVKPPARAPAAAAPGVTAPVRRDRRQRRPPPLTEAQRRLRDRRLRRLRRRLRLALVVTGAAASVAAWYQVPRLSVFDVREIAVLGASATSDLQVRSSVDEMMRGRTIYTVDRERTERRVRELPFVSSAHVDRHFPSGISISIVEYEPLAFGVAGNGGWLVARDGRVLTRARLDDWRDRAPVVRLEHESVQAGDRVGDEPALRLLRALPPTFPGTFRAVELTNGIFVAVMHDGPEIRFGRDADLSGKLVVAQRLLTFYGPHARGRITYVDVSVPARPAVMAAS